jgi:hypothetical protein
MRSNMGEHAPHGKKIISADGHRDLFSLPVGHF